MPKKSKMGKQSIEGTVKSTVVNGTALFSQALLSVPYPVVIFGIGGKINYASPETFKEFGFSSENVIGKTWNELGFSSKYFEDFDFKRSQVFTSGIAQKDEIFLPALSGENYYEYVLTPLKLKNNQIEWVMATFWNITSRKLDEEERKLNTLRMEAMLKLYSLSGEDYHILTDFALEQMVKITNSEIGYLSFLDDDENILTMYSWSKQAMKQCMIEKKPIKYEVKSTGLWGEAIRQRKPIITNDYSAPNDFKKGYPEGHVSLRRHMNVPIFDEGKIVLLVGVGNKTQEYTEDDVNQITIIINFLWSILKRKWTDESLHNSLEEKEVLLKEIHHRVKNNMQIVSSLLGLQSDYIESVEAKRAISETQSRVKSMAMIHEKLYESQDFSRINIARYIESLTDDILRTFRINRDNISLKLDLEDYFIKLESSIPLGLIINELFTNSLKHAFPVGENGEICISINERNGEMILAMSDNGVGFPDNINFKDTDTLGLQLVNSLIRQLEGTIKLDSAQGTKFQIVFEA